jgi:hypothetical protein
MPLNLVVSNKSSALNKKLIKFFQLNLLSLNQAMLVFQFEVAHPEDMDKYVARGIKNYPVLIHNTTSVTGVEKIITYLKLHVKKYNDKIINKSDTDRVDDFWKQTLGPIKIDDSGKIQDNDDDDDDSDNLHKKIQEAFASRNDQTEHIPKQNHRPNNVQGSSSINKYNNVKSMGSSSANIDESPSSTLKNMKSGKNNSMDDDLMAKFFENQEETT